MERTMEGNNNSSIVQFYDNKTVFITGATGFMGKVRTLGRIFVVHICNSYDLILLTYLLKLQPNVRSW